MDCNVEYIQDNKKLRDRQLLKYAQMFSTFYITTHINCEYLEIQTIFFPSLSPTYVQRKLLFIQLLHWCLEGICKKFAELCIGREKERQDLFFKSYSLVYTEVAFFYFITHTRTNAKLQYTNAQKSFVDMEWMDHK